MFYIAHITRKGKLYTASFLDCPGCVTEVSTTMQALQDTLPTALNDWLADRLSQGKTPMRPINYCRGKRIKVDVFPDIATALIDRWIGVGLIDNPGHLDAYIANMKWI